MHNLFEPAAAGEILERIERLQPASARQWGRMTPAQMMCHCSAALEVASGRRQAKRTLIGRLIGPRMRHLLTSEKPFPKDSPTAKEFKVMDECDFAREKQRLADCIRHFHAAGENGCTRAPHPFFGPITPLEWSTGMYKHMDHHLRQFGV
ncbi:MAG: DUF1569 domain-containing protein [Acidobacteria bacterium]|nr:DUF1569 domain-containing protein [Acidobacteriota bacterium]